MTPVVRTSALGPARKATRLKSTHIAMIGLADHNGIQYLITPHGPRRCKRVEYQCHTFVLQVMQKARRPTY